MSKLAEKIRGAVRTQPQAVGFGTARTTKTATMVLAALAAKPADAAALASAGADVVIVGTFEAPAAADGRPECEAPLGAAIAGAAEDEAQRYREAGYDFVLFDPDRASATALLDEKVGYVMRLPGDLSETETRALDNFQLDAVDIGAIEGALSVRRQIELQRIGAMTRKPLLARVPAGISAAELRALRDAGVAVAVTDAAGVAQLRATIDALPPRSQRRDDRERPLAMVPRAAPGADHEHEHDDD